MKLKYIFTALVATLTVAVSCEKASKEYLDEIRVSSSYVSIPQNGGSTTITVTAIDNWTFDDSIPYWMTVTPSSGSAGETKVTFSADATLDGRSGSFTIVCGKAIQNINYIQGLPVVSKATCKEVIAGPDSKTYLVTGTCTAIANTTYGNWYLNDGTGEIYIYGTVDNSGAYNWSSFNIEVGDEVTVQGPKTTYNGTVELVDATFISINKSLIKVDSLSIAGKKISEVPIDGGGFVANVTCKGNGISVDIPESAQSWLSVAGINTGKGMVIFNAAKNLEGDRSVELVFKTTDGKKDYTANYTIKQKGSIVAVSCKEFNAKPDGDALYKVRGTVTKIAKDDQTKNYTNFYFKDFSGEEVYVYGTYKADGTAISAVKEYGLKEGDIVTMVGKKGSYKTTLEMLNAYVETYQSVETVDIATFRALEDDKTKSKFYRISGVVTNLTSVESGTKFDLATYGNYHLVDETGAIYVYGTSTGVNGESKKFGTLGVAEGDIVTILTYKGSYNGLMEACGAMYVSHIPAEK